MEKIFQAKYEQYKDEIIKVRHEVFVIGQNISSELEIDGKDSDCFHVLVMIDKKPIATGRMEKDGHIGRIAVLKKYRRKDHGTKVMKKLEEIAKNKSIKKTYLGSQVHATNFYFRLGYESYGNFYFEAGIKHIKMRKYL